MPFRAPVTVVPTAARTSSGNAVVAHNELGDTLVLFLNVSAASGTSPTLTVTVEWSPDGTNFYTTDTADSFTQLTAVKQVVKAFQMKGPYYRLSWTTGGTSPSFTFAVQHYVTT